MHKNEILENLARALRDGEIDKSAVMKVVKENHSDDDLSKTGATKLLFFIGGAIAIIGVIAFASQVWIEIGAFARVAITLGFGLVMAFLGSMFLNKIGSEKLGNIFHIIGGVFIPSGAMVLLSEFNVETVSLWPIAITFAVISMFYFILSNVHRSPVLTFFTIVNVTIFLYQFTGALVENSIHIWEDLFRYLTAFVGVSYLLTGYSFKSGWNRKLAQVLYFAGTIAFLSAGFPSGNDGLVWEMLYFPLTAYMIYSAIYLRSTAVLAISTIFLLAHIGFITGKYFADSLGWPVTLILLGFVFIFLGHFSVKIQNKFIRK